MITKENSLKNGLISDTLLTYNAHWYITNIQRQSYCIYKWVLKMSMLIKVMSIFVAVL